VKHQETSNSTIQHPDSEDVFTTPLALLFDNLDAHSADLQKPSHTEAEMRDTFEGGADAFGMDTGMEESLGSARKEFEDKLKNFGLWGGLEAAATENMDHIKDAWDEVEQDDILNEILQKLGKSA
jgi:hypothetical protein